MDENNQDILYKKCVLNQDGKWCKSTFFEDKLFETSELREDVEEHLSS